MPKQSDERHVCSACNKCYSTKGACDRHIKDANCGGSSVHRPDTSVSATPKLASMFTPAAKVRRVDDGIGEPLAPAETPEVPLARAELSPTRETPAADADTAPCPAQLEPRKLDFSDSDGGCFAFIKAMDSKLANLTALVEQIWDAVKPKPVTRVQFKEHNRKLGDVVDNAIARAKTGAELVGAVPDLRLGCDGDSVECVPCVTVCGDQVTGLVGFHTSLGLTGPTRGTFGKWSVGDGEFRYLKKNVKRHLEGEPHAKVAKAIEAAAEQQRLAKKADVYIAYRARCLHCL